MKHNRPPYFTNARFNSTCPETGLAIKTGDEIAYFPETKKAYHRQSKNAEIVRALEFSRSWGMADANY